MAKDEEEEEVSSFARFITPDGLGVLLDLDGFVACWEGEAHGTLVILVSGLDDAVTVVADFDTFVTDHFGHYDIRPKKRPRLKKRGPPKLRLVEPTSASTAREDTP